MPHNTTQHPRPARAAVALCVATVWLLASSAALAEADGPDHYRVVNVAADDVLNIRIEPDPAAVAIGSIPPGANCIRNLGCQGGLSLLEFQTMTEDERAARLEENPRWCKVEYQDQVGWVAGRYLAEGGCD